MQKQLDELKLTATAPTDDAIWDEMAVHPAIDFASNVLMKPGDSGLWEQSDVGASRYAVKGRVYQESYKGTWHSYALSARAIMVSDYQFRHPMEWFAECYAKYFLRQPGPSHPLSKWLDTQTATAPTT